jgi:hypothetical protein
MPMSISGHLGLLGLALAPLQFPDPYMPSLSESPI